ncbi:MAG: cyclic nucleotide-binding domain-containing protein [Gemmatimonadota bacterium]|nr:MAG: cyclic nucleotide-binding domain-containing protein [Gemmatimonadota bacterium]
MVPVDILKKVSIFQGLEKDELASIAGLASEETYGASTRILTDGNIAEYLYILIEGEVDIQTKLKSISGPVSVDKIEEGEMFGWSALVEPYSLTASAITVTKSKIIVLPATELRDLFDKNSHIGYIVMKEVASVISSRFRQTIAGLLEYIDAS